MRNHRRPTNLRDRIEDMEGQIRWQGLIIIILGLGLIFSIQHMDTCIGQIIANMEGIVRNIDGILDLISKIAHTLGKEVMPA